MLAPGHPKRIRITKTGERAWSATHHTDEQLEGAHTLALGCPVLCPLAESILEVLIMEWVLGSLGVEAS